MRYRLDELGWHQFENLCQSLLKAKFGDAIESWGGSRDIGRDAYCSRPIELVKGVSSAAPLVFQVKFVNAANSAGANWNSLLNSAVRKECALLKAKREQRMVEEIKEYILISNGVYTPELRAEVCGIIKQSLPHANVTAFGGNDVCDWLDDRPNIRWSFPQLVSLRDIELLLADRVRFSVHKLVLERSSIQLELARSQAAAFVPTKTYFKALNVLRSHKFLVLSGPPEVGKTTIARMIGLNAHYLGWQCYEVHSPDEMLTIIERNSRSGAGSEEKIPPQLFIADDAFGTTEYDEDFARDWTKDLDKVIGVLDSRHLMIWTSRSAPLAHALEYLRLQGPAERFPDPAKVVVDSSDLVLEEKALILYRHAKYANLEDQARQILRTHAYTIVSDEHFTPERIRRFVHTDLGTITGTVGIEEHKVESAIARQLRDPTKSMRQSFRSLSEYRQRFLVSLLDCASHAVVPQDAYDAFLRIFGDVVDKRPPLIAEDLDEQFIRLVRGPKHGSRSELVYEWVHPSWRDLLIDHLVDHRLTRQRFLGRCSVSGIALSLSSAGGAAGRRSFPLVIEDSDWNCLTSNVSALVPNLKAKDLERLLFIVSAAFKHSSQGDEQERRLFELASACIHASSLAWAQRRAYATTNALRSYYSICRSTKITLDPGLSGIWTEVFFDLVELVIEGTDFEVLTDELGSIAEYIRLTQDESPQFFDRIVAGGKAQREILDLALDVFEDEAESEYESWGRDNDTRESCKVRFKKSVKDLETIARLAPEFSEKISKSKKRCVAYIQDIEEQEAEEEEEERKNTDEQFFDDDDSEDVFFQRGSNRITAAIQKPVVQEQLPPQRIVSDLFEDL